MSTTTPDSETPICVPAGPGDVVGVRMPTRTERQALGMLTPGIPVLSIKRPGEAEELFDARLVTIVVGGPQEAIC